MADLITEATAPSAAAVLTEAKGNGVKLMTIITPGWGSSGYYSEALLKEAVDAGVWTRGTQQHIDHQTAEERAVKPEGSISTLASVLTENARWDPSVVDKETGAKTGGVVAEAKIFSRWREPLEEMAEYIGISIVAPADRVVGEAEGRAGLIVEKLYPSKLNRVDFVTVAGRGGHMSTESAGPAPVAEARNVGQWLEARMHSMFTGIADEFYGDGRLTREERITLSGALGEALTSFTARVDADAPQLFERDLWDEPTAAVAATEALSAALKNPALPTDEARALVTESLSPEALPTIVEATPGQTATTPVGGNNMADVLVEATRLAQLEDASGRVPALEAAVEAAEGRATIAERARAVAESTVRARDFATNLVHDANSELSESVVARIVAQATHEIPLGDDLRLDTAALTEAVTAARTAEETYLATLSVESGLGRVRGVGSPDEKDQPTITMSSAREAILANAGLKK